MNNNNKNIKNIEKCVQQASNYINEHGKHFLHIFSLYGEIINIDDSADIKKDKAKKMFNEFVKIFIKLQLFVRHVNHTKKGHLVKLLEIQKTIFVDITEKVLTATQHQKVDIVTAKVYIKLLIKLLNKTTMPTPFVPKPCVSSDSSTKSPCDNNIDNNINGDVISEPLPINVLKKNKKYLEIAVNGLKSVAKLFSMINVILLEMQKEYLQKINCYNLYDQSSQVNANDVEYNVKLLTTSYAQLTSLISTGSSIFNETTDTVPVEVFLDDGKTFVLCTVDNFRIRLSTTSGFKCILIDIGTHQYVVKILKESLDNGSTVLVMKENFNAVKNATHAIILNQKLIIYWLNVIRENTK